MTAIQLQEAYQPRPIRFLDLWAFSGWRIKVYGIAYRAESPAAALVTLAQATARERLPRAGEDNYGVGFLGVHQGRNSNFIFVDWWADENELHHHVYVSYPGKPYQLAYATPSGLIACVWDLRLLAFERQAWIDTVLMPPDTPDLDAYLCCRLNETA